MFGKAKRLWYSLRHPVIGEVWQLHHVTDSPAPSEEWRPYYITPTRLEELILRYRKKGYDFVSLDEISRPRNHKFIAVTLDDGYEDNYMEAWPVFRRLSVPFCIFVATDFVYDDAVRMREKGMTPEELKEIASDPLCTVGGHTKSHCHLNALSASEQEKEIIGGINVLKCALGLEIKHFAFPYGDFDKETIDILKRCGLMGYAAWGGEMRNPHLNSVYPRLFTR